MIYLALTILSTFFVVGFAATCLWGAYIIIGLIILGTREVIKFYWRETVKEWKAFIASCKR